MFLINKNNKLQSKQRLKMAVANEHRINFNDLTPRQAELRINLFGNVKKISGVAGLAFVALAAFLYPSFFCLLPLACAYASFEIFRVASNMKNLIQSVRDLPPVSCETILSPAQLEDLTARTEGAERNGGFVLSESQRAFRERHGVLGTQNFTPGMTRKQVLNEITRGAPLTRLLFV